MRLEVTLKHINNPPPTFKEYLEEKLRRLERFDHLVQRVHVVASDEHTHNQDTRYVVEAIAHLPRGHEVVAKVAGSCLFEATDALIDRLEKQVVRIKEQVQRHRGRGA